MKIEVLKYRLDLKIYDEMIKVVKKGGENWGNWWKNDDFLIKSNYLNNSIQWNFGLSKREKDEVKSLDEQFIISIKKIFRYFRFPFLFVLPLPLLFG